jgi:hypothetical protein
VGFYNTSDAREVYVQGGLAYVADSSGGLIILRYTGDEPYIDLSISNSDISVSPSDSPPGMMNITAQIHNVGSLDVQNIVVRFLDENLSTGKASTIDEQTIPQLAAFESTELTALWQPLMENHRLHDASGNALALWMCNTADPSLGDTGTLNEILSHQEIRFSKWDGVTWSEPIFITNDNVPDGLAAIAADNSGNAMAVWVRDLDADVLTRADSELWFATWDGGEFC